MSGNKTPFTVRYHPQVRDEDIPRLSKDVRQRVRKAIEERLATSPHEYGQPLRKTLKGYWKLRVGDYRVVYRIEKQTVVVLGIRHRKDIYEEIEERQSK
jgi:mRNA interferase RelE/StbE